MNSLTEAVRKFLNQKFVYTLIVSLPLPSYSQALLNSELLNTVAY